MSQTLPRIDGPGDAELISAVRGGDLDAYGDLFARHVGSARALARQLVNPTDADDLVSDAFGKVLGVLQRGGGPDVAFRAYLLTAVRRLHIDKIRANSKLHTTDDMEKFDPGTPFRDTAVEGFENAAAAAAFSSLPERWQLVLWHTEVEGQKPAEVAELLGMSANSVSALAYRAREGLRQAYLNGHAQELDDATCRWTHSHLGAYVRKGVSRRDAAKVEEHLDECRKCMAIYLELTEVNSNLAGILGPLLLGGAAAGYAAAMGAAAPAGFLGLVSNLKSQINPVIAGAVAAAVAAGGIAAGAVAVNYNDDVVVGSPPPAKTNPVDGDSDAGNGGDGAAPAPAPAPETEDKPAEKAKKPKKTPAPAEDSAPADTPAPVNDQSTADEPVTSPPRDKKPNKNKGQVKGDTKPNPDAQQDEPDPSPDPDPDPDPPPPPLPTFDLALGAGGSAPSNANDPWLLFANVTGLSPGGSATLTINGDGRLNFLNLDPACTNQGGGRAECTISSAPSTINFVIEQFPGGPMTVNFTLTKNGATEDVNPNNNTRTLTLTQH